MKPSIRVIFDNGYDEQYVQCIELDEHIAREFNDVKPPPPAPFGSFDLTVETLRVRQFRRDLFISECKRLGMLLADTMEDSEGWHDASRIEPAKRSLKGA